MATLPGSKQLLTSQAPAGGFAVAMSSVMLTLHCACCARGAPPCLPARVLLSEGLCVSSFAHAFARSGRRREWAS